MEEDSMRKKILVGGVVAVVALLLRGAAYAAVTVTFKASVSPSKAGKPTALKVSILSNDPAAEQPPIMNRIVIKLDGKAKFNPSKFKRCKLSSLQAKGPKGCPSASKIGTGNGIGMARPVVTDPVNAKLTMFNGRRTGGKDTIYVYVFPDLGPTFVTVGKVSHRGGKYVLDFSIPPIKTLPSAPDASVVSVKTKTPIKRVTKRRHGKRKKYYLIVAPSKCKGSWKGSGTFYFRTGERVDVPISQKCKK
jgi:hypothetical protein